MKVGVIGNGKVGLAVYRELQDVREVSEVVLIGRNPEKIRGEVEDYRDAALLRNYPSPRFSGGGYEMSSGCDILIYTAGTSALTKERMDLLNANSTITREIFEQINPYNQDAIVICVTNPLDVITTVIRETTGRDRKKVIGTGTLLDSARLTRYVAELLEIAPNSVSMQVVGEHGNSSVILLSTCRLNGKTVEEYFVEEVGGGRIDAQSLTKAVQEDGLKILLEKGYTSSGVACAACRVVSAIAGDTRELLPVSVVLDGEYGLSGFAISTPCIIGREGVLAVKEVRMTDSETERFLKSASIIRDAVKSISPV